jgi:hypothetical protein
MVTRSRAPGSSTYGTALCRNQGAKRWCCNTAHYPPSRRTRALRFRWILTSVPVGRVGSAGQASRPAVPLVPINQGAPSDDLRRQRGRSGRSGGLYCQTVNNASPLIVAHQVCAGSAGLRKTTRSCVAPIPPGTNGLAVVYPNICSWPQLLALARGR